MRGRSFRCFLLILSLIIVDLFSPSLARAAIEIGDAPHFIDEDLEIWEDSSAAATAEIALQRGDFKRAPPRVHPNKGYSRSAFFFRFTLSNAKDERGLYALDVGREWMTDVDLYRVDGDRVVLDARAGASVPRGKRPLSVERPTFLIDLGPHETRTFLLRIAGPAPIGVIGEITRHAEFVERHELAALGFGVFYGVVLGIALYSAIIFAVLRDAQWRLAVALVGYLIGETAAHGHLTLLLPWTISHLELHASALGFGLFVPALFAWTRVVLKTDATPRLDRALRIFGVVGAALCLIAAITVRAHILTWVGCIPGVALPMIVGVVRWRGGHPPARPYVVAVGVFMLPAALVIAAILGIFPLYPISEHGTHVGSTMMAVLFALIASQEMRATRSNLEARNRDISSLVDELRHQVVERSRELSLAFERATRAPGTTSLQADDVVDRRYRVVRQLGAGGMGIVYEVERASDARRFALKVLSGTTSPEAAIRLTREAEVGAQLRHPNLVPIIDVGIGQGDTPFLVMELVEGGSLENRREQFGQVVWALGVLRGMASGLTALHEAGVIHRDLKPSNVLMDAGLARISDFGISKRTDSADPQPPRELELAKTIEADSVRRRLTATGAIVGTPLYMAPEAMARGNIGPEADIFAFGLIACELLTGEFPFAIFGPASLRTRSSSSSLLDGVSGISESVAKGLVSCLAIDPRDRPSATRIVEILG